MGLDGSSVLILPSNWSAAWFPWIGGGRYIENKLSKADISAFFKLSPKLSILEIWIWKLSTNYRYRKMHQIWSDKYMKSQTIRNLVSANFYPKSARQISPSWLFRMNSSTDSTLILCPVIFFLLLYFEPFCRILHFFAPFCCKIRNIHILGVKL